MANLNGNPESFLGCFVQDKGVLRVISQIDELKDAGSAGTASRKWVRDENRWYISYIDWHATKILVRHIPGDFELYITGPAGIVSVGLPDAEYEEEINSTSDGPKHRGDICDLRLVGDRLYACGMSRQVYRREGKDLWSRQDGGVVQPKGALEIAGFNAIDGLSEEDIFAVGFGGEIWRRKKDRWTQLDSPTNLVLTGLRVVSSSLAFACGQQGLLLRGTGDRWEAISQTATKEDFWGIEWFQDKLYISTIDGIYVLNKSGQDIARVKVNVKSKLTFSHLHQNDGLLLSVGPKHVIYTEDGQHWVDMKA